ncbi:(2Fe-2S)-binding protein [Rhodococcus zopfii]|uniref:(2Fe-2S)-binding protein n=1 Tax=Rhodococcus zopfii TaxID=43772 RepID=UPI003529CBA3
MPDLDATTTLDRLTTYGPYFTVGTGSVPDGNWQPTATLRERAVRDDLVAATAERMGVAEARVAASTLFFGYAARLWSVAVGSIVVAGRCVNLDIEELLWRSESGALHLHLEHPRFGGPADAEVLDGQLAPLIAAWRDTVAPGLLWGNTASALCGAGEVLGPDADVVVAALFRDVRLSDTLDPASGRRRSCCLFYRTGSGGVCGDCPFPAAPLVQKHSGPELRS